MNKDEAIALATSISMPGASSQPFSFNVPIRSLKIEAVSFGEKTADSMKPLCASVFRGYVRDDSSQRKTIENATALYGVGNLWGADLCFAVEAATIIASAQQRELAKSFGYNIPDDGDYYLFNLYGRASIPGKKLRVSPMAPRNVEEFDTALRIATGVLQNKSAPVIPNEELRSRSRKLSVWLDFKRVEYELQTELKLNAKKGNKQ